jgi:hypothetical protein
VAYPMSQMGQSLQICGACSMSALHPIATESPRRKGRARGLPCCSVQQIRQLGEVRGRVAGLVPGEQLGRCAPAGLILEIEIPERLAGAIADDDPDSCAAANVPAYFHRPSAAARQAGGACVRCLVPSFHEGKLLRQLPVLP